jgi:hypothetical protein
MTFESKMDLIEQNLFHVVFVAKEFEHMGQTIEDLISIGTIGLIKAVNGAEQAGEVPCSDEYMSECIRKEISSFIRAHDRGIHKPMLKYARKKEGHVVKNVDACNKVALYCRIDSLSSADTDLSDIQMDVLRSHAKAQGFEIYMEYKDMGYNGNDLNRPAFIQMDNAITLGEIDTVVIRSIDRISRDAYLADEWIDGLKERGANLITVNGEYNPDFSTSGFAEHLKAVFFNRREVSEGLTAKTQQKFNAVLFSLVLAQSNRA